MTSIELIILYEKNCIEIDSLVQEANLLNIKCILIHSEWKEENIKLENNCYLIYSITDKSKTQAFISFFSKRCKLIHYTFGRTAVISMHSFLKNHEIPYVKISSYNNTELVKKIDEIGGFPIILSSSQFSNSLGKYYIEDKQNFLQLIDVISNKGTFDYILKYIEHDFHIRIYIVNNQFNSAVIYYKHKEDYSTNRLAHGSRCKMLFVEKISPDIKQLAIHYIKYLQIETAGVDILVSRANQHYLLEANNPMMYHVVSESLPVVSKAIIQGLLKKLHDSRSTIRILPSSLPSLLVDAFSETETIYPEVNFAAKQLQLKLIACNEYQGDCPIIVLNSRYLLTEEYRFSNHVFGFNTPLLKPLNMRKTELLKKKNIFAWSKYNIDFCSPQTITTNDLNQQCTFPIVIKIEDSLINITYLLAKTVTQCLSILSIYQDSKYKCNLYPFIYIYVKRKALLVGSRVIAIIEYVAEDDNRDSLFNNTNNTIILNDSDISTQELDAYKLVSDILLFQGAWSLEYVIDIQSNFYLLSYDNGYHLSDYTQLTSDLLLTKIINKLYEAYLEKYMFSSLYNSILSLDNVFQKFHLLYAFQQNLSITPLDNSLEYAQLSNGAITHQISNCYFGPRVLPQKVQLLAINKAKLYKLIAKKFKQNLIPTMIITSKSIKTAAGLKKKINSLPYPLVIKPAEGLCSENVFINVDSDEEAIKIINSLMRNYKEILIQQMWYGFEFRVFIVNNRVIAVAKKQPDIFIGDGKSSIVDIVEQRNVFYKNYNNSLTENSNINLNIKIDEIHNNYYLRPKIIIDNAFIDQLEKLGYSLTSILKNNEKITLPFASFYGSTWIDQTEAFPKDIADHLIKINKYVGLKISGADILINDSGDLKIIEFNCYPATLPHHFITYGNAQPVVQKIFDLLFNEEWDCNV